MNRYKISIIVPIYNAEKYLRKCVDSLINQTYSNTEIICVNDGSTDNSYAILKEYARKDKRIILINQDNHGVSETRNKAMQLATGEYLMFVDSDDWIDLNTCELVVNTIVEHDADVLLWPYIREYDTKSSRKEIFKEPILIFDEENTKKNLYRRLVGPINNELSKPENLDSLVTACMKLYKNSIVKSQKIEFVDTKIIGTEDALFNIYYFAHVKKAVYLNEFLYHYRRDNSQSLTTKYRANLFTQWSSLYELIESHIIVNNLANNFFSALDNRIAFNIIGLGLNELSSNEKSTIIIKRLKEIIKSARFNKAIKSLEIKYLPIHWKVFFIAAEIESASLIYILLILINKLR